MSIGRADINPLQIQRIVVFSNKVSSCSIPINSYMSSLLWLISLYGISDCYDVLERSKILLSTQIRKTSFDISSDTFLIWNRIEIKK